MKKNKEAVVMCILKCEEVCDPSCSMYAQCWDEEEINKKKNNEQNY